LFSEFGSYARTHARGIYAVLYKPMSFTAKYVPLLHHMAQERGISFQVKHIRSREEAQNAPTPYTTYDCKF
jgi:hypothetical protein